MHYQASYHYDWLELDPMEKLWEGCKMRGEEIGIFMHQHLRITI